MTKMRKVAVRMVIGGMLLGMPAALMAQTNGGTPSVLDDNGNINWRNAFIRLFYEAALGAVQSGCNGSGGSQN